MEGKLVDTKKDRKAKYLELFGLSEAPGEESPADKDRRLTKEIQDSEQRLQGWRDKRTSVLSYTLFRKRLRAVENCLLTQELSPFLKGYQSGYFSKGDRERIRFMSAPEGELRIAFPHEPIFPVFQKAPKNSASILYFVDGPDPSRICRLEIYEDESNAVSKLEKVEREIIREEETLSDLQREFSDNRIEALMENISLPSDEPQEGLLSETPDEEPPEEKESESGKRVDPESSGPPTEGGTDHEAGEEREKELYVESEGLDRKPGRKADDNVRKRRKVTIEFFTGRGMSTQRGMVSALDRKAVVKTKRVVAALFRTYHKEQAGLINSDDFEDYKNWLEILKDDTACHYAAESIRNDLKNHWDKYQEFLPS